MSDSPAVAARPDLLALTPDDLTVLSNRGLVKRAIRELESGEVTPTVTQSTDGAVTVQWSDGVVVTFPVGRTITDAVCSIPSVTLSRHVIRSVLAYQQWAACTPSAMTGDGSEEKPPVPADPDSPAPAIPFSPPPLPGAESIWDPGAIVDDALRASSRKGADIRAAQLLDQGQIVELVRSTKPSARFHTLAVTVRFLVPGEPSYAVCDCAEPSPCVHALMAVHAFRLLPQGQDGGLVSTFPDNTPIPVPFLDEAEKWLRDFASAGLANAPRSLIDRLRRLREKALSESLLWPASILEELILEQQRYESHDARFDPVHVARLTGELIIRMDAIRSSTGAVPQPFIRGLASDTVMELSGSRLIGLGCEARVTRASVTLVSYLQDQGTGTVVTAVREFPDPPADSGHAPASFAELARTHAVKDASFRALGAGQLLTRGAKCTADRRFSLGRASSVVQPQTYQWEHLRSPVLVESFGEVRARLAAMPPRCLRPRRFGEDLFVVPLRQVDAVWFDNSAQTVHAVLVDPHGHEGHLHHSFTARGRPGVEALFNQLLYNPDKARFISGSIRMSASTPVVSPLCVVFDSDNGRTAVQPWLEESPSPGGATPQFPENIASEADPVSDFPAHVLEAIGELLLTGCEASGSRIPAQWEQLHHQGERLGFHRYLVPVADVAAELGGRSSDLHWIPDSAVASLLECAAWTVLALEGQTS